LALVGKGNRPESESRERIKSRAWLLETALATSISYRKCLLLLRVVRCLPTNEYSAKRRKVCWAGVGQANFHEGQDDFLDAGGGTDLSSRCPPTPFCGTDDHCGGEQDVRVKLLPRREDHHYG